MSDAITPFRVEIATAEIEDLRRRLAATRWPDAETTGDWSQGIPLAYMKELCAYWATRYDMERVAKRLNALPQFRTGIDAETVAAAYTSAVLGAEFQFYQDEERFRFVDAIRLFLDQTIADLERREAQRKDR